MKARVFTEKEKQAVIKMYQSGIWIDEIARLLKTAKEKVALLLDEAGIERVRTIRATKAQREAVKELYLAGETYESIVRQVSLSKPTIISIVQGAGLPSRTEVLAIKKKKAVDLYISSRLTADQICQETGIGKATLYRELKKLEGA